MGTGPVKEVTVFEVRKDVLLLPGDVMLSDYEEELPAAWTESFARKARGYNVMCALSEVVARLAAKYSADVVLYDVGPNVGALNRAVLLDCDYFITPVAADLFSLRALTTVGRSVGKWVKDWSTVRSLASAPEQKRLLAGKPAFIGYVASAFKVSSGQRKAQPHTYWESKIASRVTKRVIEVLKAIDPSLVGTNTSNKIGEVKHFHSLAASAQEHGIAIGKLRGVGNINSGSYAQVDEAKREFAVLAKEIAKRASL
jgi:hypothetical protein